MVATQILAHEAVRDGDESSPVVCSAAEQSRRLWARDNLHGFCEYMADVAIDNPWQTGLHLQRLCDKLMDVEAGRCKRLMVFMPPQHGKSTIVSQRFPCWALGRNPRLQITQSGYGSNITMMHSRAARDLFATPECHNVFPTVFHRPERASQAPIQVERQAAHEWGTTKRGVYYAASVRSAMTGRRSDIAIIDDPHKNREEAESITKRDLVWDWYTSTLYTRLSPQASIILVMTRWHEDDLAGRLLKKMKDGTGDKWDVLTLPAISRDGEFEVALWPQRFDLERLRAIRNVQPPRDWAALYQQSPTVEGGTVFKERWWPVENRFDSTNRAHTNRCVSRLLSFDTASKDGEDNDYTAMIVAELSPEYEANLRYVERTKKEFTDLLAFVVGNAKKFNRDDKLEAILIEDKSSGIALIQTLLKQAPDWVADLVVPVTPDKQKLLRWHEATTWCANGSVHLPLPHESVDWLREFELELFAVPSAPNDDQADAFAQMVWYWTNLFTEGLGAQLLREEKVKGAAA